MLFLRRIIKSLLVTAVVGFVIRKAMSADNPNVRRFGHQANRLVGGVIGLDETGHRLPRRRRRAMTSSAGSAVIGGVMSYFFDPQQGRHRRERARTFAQQKLARRNGHELRSAADAPAGTTGDAPFGAAQSASAIT